MVKAKLTAIWRIITARAFYLLSQRHYGQAPDVHGYGGGQDIKDMVLMSVAMKQSYDHFITMINNIATETGDLHTLRQLRDAIDTIGEHDGGN